MGFFSSLFARKNANNASLKGQAYKSTVAGDLPIQGTYPVAGNGPNVLDQLQRAARKRSQAQLSMVSQDVDDPAAPPPMISRHRGMSPSRPTTAPNQANSLSSRPLSLSRSIRSSNSAWSVPERPARSRQRPPPVPSIPTHHRRESSADSNKRNSFIDILDAQGEFKLSNFRSRVAASGAREYGEDVAERNMSLGENSLNLNAAATKAFYRLSGSGMSGGGLSGSGRPEAYQSYGWEDEEDDSAPAPGVPHGDTGTKRDKSSRPSSSTAWRSISGSLGNDLLRSSKSNLRDRQTSQSNLNPRTLSMGDRRRSFNAFASPSEPEPEPEPKPRKPRPLSLHPSLSGGLSYEAASSPPPVPRSRPKTSEGRIRPRSFGRVEIDTVDEAFENFDEPAPCPTIPARFRQEHRTSAYLEPNSRHDRSHVHHPRPGSYHGGSTLSSYPRSDMSQASRPSSSSSIDKQFTRSRAPLHNKRLDDINEHIPVRTSSLNVQFQPITPSTMSSSFSSNQFGHHTPSTSIDDCLPPSIKMRPEHEQSSAVNYNTRQSPQSSTGDDFSAETLVPSRMDIEQHLGHPVNIGNDMDLYLSDASEDSVDSFIAWKEKRRDGEVLLMKDTYGMAGEGLPGLFEPLPILKGPTELAPPPIPKVPSELAASKRPKTPKSPRRPSTRSPRSNKSTPRSRQLRQSRSRTSPRHTCKGSSSEDDADSFWDSDIPPGPGFVSLADLGIDLRQLGWDQYGLTEADDAKVDIQTAIKLRKAMKHRKQRREDDEGCVADAED
ncbi:hypothetical protein F53441_13228 [Fusarium austroafricanum]|uniref:Uncharacterized protein n=1 Tax=Fusarium austroafricanum TaxID=2364996 RepID=A0A8H4NS29_9HYPO|nr:hypothetical protein F53441_13228 [Fusarium austroafricanum]